MNRVWLYSGYNVDSRSLSGSLRTLIYVDIIGIEYEDRGHREYENVRYKYLSASMANEEEDLILQFASTLDGGMIGFRHFLSWPSSLWWFIIFRFLCNRI